MITLILLHSNRPVPLHRWTFEDKPILRIGRSKDNDVIIGSAVVSRHHLELWNKTSGWELVNFGANGTYVNNQMVNKRRIVDGMVVRLGHTGPRLLIRLKLVNDIHLNKQLDIPDLEDLAANDITESDPGHTTRIEFDDDDDD
ncbi:MAG: FHA domain-containing protein [Arthrospira sp. SH-MAG29]|nr:FHA domain-containing protein [Arthrospira sp. SH-MAG29]MBS0017574.1 FHA domain-containing protein [Arthrospira sp. SH-MAG29]